MGEAKVDIVVVRAKDEVDVRYMRGDYGGGEGKWCDLCEDGQSADEARLSIRVNLGVGL